MNHSARFPQFSIAALLGAMIVIGAVLAVFRISLFGGCAFAAIVLPALVRAYWAEALRIRAGGKAAQGDAIGTYLVSLTIMVMIAGASLAVADAFADWRKPGHGQTVISTLVASAFFCFLFWLTRPRARHYLP